MTCIIHASGKGICVLLLPTSCLRALVELARSRIPDTRGDPLPNKTIDHHHNFKKHKQIILFNCDHDNV